MNIRVVHTIHAFTPLSGGIATCTYDLLRALNTREGVEASLVVTKPEGLLMGKGEGWIIPVENDEITPFAISKQLKQALIQTDADIYHTNGLWRYCNHLTAEIARKKGRPYVITSHGMLYPEALSHSLWQKKILLKCLFNEDIRSASCIHVTCEEEMQHIRALGYTTPIAVIGNPVSEPAIEPIKRKGEVVFGYLGRLHPIKQVERIIEAMSILSPDEQKKCRLEIMGSGEAGYELFLKRLVEEKGLKNIHFTGFIEGEEKERRLASLSALFVPSASENFGMIVTEALSCGTPVFANTTTPWAVLNEQGCGWWHEATSEQMAGVMQEILCTPPRKIDEMGLRGRDLVARRFSFEEIARQMSELYQWIITKQNKPSFVYE